MDNKIVFTSEDERANYFLKKENESKNDDEQEIIQNFRFNLNDNGVIEKLNIAHDRVQGLQEKINLLIKDYEEIKVIFDDIFKTDVVITRSGYNE